MRTKLFFPIISGLLCLSVPTAVFAEQPVSGTVQTATTQPVKNPETASKAIDVPGSSIHNDWVQPGWQQIADNNPEAALSTWQQGVNRLPPEQLLAFIGVYSRRSNAIKQLKRIGSAERAIILYSDYKEKKAYYVMSAQDVPVDHQSRRKKLASLAKLMATNGKIYANAASKFQVPGNGGEIAAEPINQQTSESDPTPQAIKPPAPTVSAVKNTNLQTDSASTPDSGGEIFNVTGNSLVSTEAIDQRLQSFANKKLSRDMLFQARQSIIGLYKERGFDRVAIAIPETLTKTPLQLHIFEDDIRTSQAVASMKTDHSVQIQPSPDINTKLSSDWIEQGWQYMAQNQVEAAISLWQRGVNNMPSDRLLAFAGVYTRRSAAAKQLRRLGLAEKAMIVHSALKDKSAYYVLSARNVPADKSIRRKKLASLYKAMQQSGTIFANAAGKFQTASADAITTATVVTASVSSGATPNSPAPTHDEQPPIQAVETLRDNKQHTSEPDTAKAKNTLANSPAPMPAVEKKTPASNSLDVFSISAFEITGNKLVPSNELQQRLKAFLGQDKTRTDIFNAKQTIVSMYEQAGHEGVAVAVPDNIVGDIIKLQIFEDDINTASISTARKFVDTASTVNVSANWIAQGWQQLEKNNSDAALVIWQQGVNKLPSQQLLAFLGVYTQMPAAVRQLKRAGLAEKAIILQSDFKGKKAYYVMSARNVPADKSMRREKLASLHEAIHTTSTLYANAVGKFQTEVPVTAIIPESNTFTIKTFNIIGNTLIADAVFQETLKYYTGNNKTREDLIAAKQAILRLYRDEGYEMVAVGLTRKITGNTIPIRVFEARIGKVWVSGGAKKTGKGIKSAMSALKPGETANADLLDEQLRAISRKNNVKAAQLVYHPTKKGVVDVEIMVDETNPMKIGLMASSLGTQETGQTLITGIFYHDNVWNAGHKLTLSYTVSEKVRNLRLYSAMYQIPVETLDGNLILSMSRADVASGQVLGVLDTRGNGTLKSIHYEQTLFRTASSRHYLDIGYEQHLFHERFSNVVLPFTLSIGILAKPVVLGYGFEGDNDYGQFGLHVSYYHNTPVGTQKGNASYRLLNPAAFANWNLLRLGADYKYDWENGWSFSGKAGGQISNNALIAGERFYITGMSKVRGFEEVEASGDTAFFLRTQLTSPNWLPDMRFHAFVDAGRYKLNFPFPGEFGSDKIVSTGLGAHWTPAFGVDVMAEAGIVLNSLPVAPNGSMTGHFKVIYWFQ